jgi:hypothetical protein
MKFWLSLILCLLPAAVEASASCAALETGAPVCALWTRSDAVFTGKALKVDAAPANEGFPEGARKVRFQVQRNFKGADNPTFTVVVTADCGFNIKTGQTWIVYARNDIVVKSFSAIRAVKIDQKVISEEAGALQDIFDGKTASAISGRFVSDAEKGVYALEPIEIGVSGGGKTLTARTDANGAFHIPLTDGNYRVELRFPYRASLKWDENLLGTTLAEGVPTVFKYEVRLNDGDCHFGVFEVSGVKN